MKILIILYVREKETNLEMMKITGNTYLFMHLKGVIIYERIYAKSIKKQFTKGKQQRKLRKYLRIADKNKSDNSIDLFAKTLLTATSEEKCYKLFLIGRDKMDI